MRPAKILSCLVLTCALAAPCLHAADLPRFDHLGTLTQARLNNEILNSELKSFAGNPGMWPGYAMPAYAPATNDVDIYRITYQSTIPEQQDRKITAYGLIAVPVAGKGQAQAVRRFPVVSYQHGTVFGKHEVPSESFGTNNGQYAGTYETRLNVAEFAGNGCVLIAADYFGMGGSTEPEAYTVKGSHQRACLDLYRCAQGWLRERNVEVSDLFLCGWSQGGLVTMDFLEKLEEEGIPVKAASTASAPADPFTLVSSWLFHPRDGKDGNTADANWVNTVVILTVFSYQNYYSNPGLAAEMFDPRYVDAYRKVYTRGYTNVTYTTDGKSMIVDGVTTPTKPLEMFKAKYQNPGVFSKSDYARYLRDASAYRWYVRTPLRMYCGMQDEAFSLNIAHLPRDYQACFHPDWIEVVDVPSATHRGTFLTAVAAQKVWFDKLRAPE